MKKLIVAAAIVCAAAVSQAASVVWGGAVSEPDGVTALAAGTQAALLYSSSAFSGAATEVDGWTAGATADNGGSIVAFYTMNSTDTDTNFSFMSTYSTEGSVDGYYAVLVLNGEGTLASYYDIGSITGTTGASSPTDKLVNMDWSGSEYLTSGGYTTAVPEPTSGLLMLLGIAGMALRRRRA